MADPKQPDPNTTGSGIFPDHPKPDSKTTGGGNTQAAAMASNPSVIWLPPAYNGKVRFDVWEAQFDMFIADKERTDKPKMVRALLQNIGSDMFEKIIDWCAPVKPIKLFLLSFTFVIMK